MTKQEALEELEQCESKWIIFDHSNDPVLRKEFIDKVKKMNDTLYQYLGWDECTVCSWCEAPVFDGSDVCDECDSQAMRDLRDDEDYMLKNRMNFGRNAGSDL